MSDAIRGGLYLKEFKGQVLVGTAQFCTNCANGHQPCCIVSGKV